MILKVKHLEITLTQVIQIHLIIVFVIEMEIYILGHLDTTRVGNTGTKIPYPCPPTRMPRQENVICEDQTGEHSGSTLMNVVDCLYLQQSGLYKLHKDHVQILVIVTR